MLEDEGVVDVDGLADLVVHGVDVGLVHGHALPGQRRGVEDRDVVELGVVLPVLVWDRTQQYYRIDPNVRRLLIIIIMIKIFELHSEVV